MNYINNSKTINKISISTQILFITLNLYGLNALIKDKAWLNGFKAKTHIYAVCKRVTSDLKAYRD